MNIAGCEENASSAGKPIQSRAAIAAKPSSSSSFFGNGSVVVFREIRILEYLHHPFVFSLNVDCHKRPPRLVAAFHDSLIPAFLAAPPASRQSASHPNLATRRCDPAQGRYARNSGGGKKSSTVPSASQPRPSLRRFPPRAFIASPWGKLSQGGGGGSIGPNANDSAPLIRTGAMAATTIFGRR